MLRQMNQIVGERRIEGRFMTACFATWQKGNAKIARRQRRPVAAAPLQRWATARKVELTGFPLGIFEEVTYDEWSGILEPATSWCSTRTESPKPPTLKGSFSATRSCARSSRQHHELQRSDIADLILREVDWFSQNAALSDDRTLVIAESSMNSPDKDSAENCIRRSGDIHATFQLEKNSQEV